MEIRILQLLEGARQARGLTVIIDVFRAFSTACYAVSMGADPVYPVGDVEEAFALKEKHPAAVLVGERNEQPLPGFDFGNSPALLFPANLKGRPMIHTTSSGTQGIVNAIHADEILTGSFVNAGAIVRYIQMKKPDVVSLVCMGYACLYPTDEDTLCAEFIRNRLLGIESDFEAMKATIRKGSGARFFESASQKWAPSADYDLCLAPDRFDFILRAVRSPEGMFLEKVDI